MFGVHGVLGSPLLGTPSHLARQPLKRDYFRAMPLYGADYGATIQFSGIESHHYLGTGKRYYPALRFAFSVLRLRHHKLHSEVGLHLTLNGTNDTMGPSGLELTLMFFGAAPSLPISFVNYSM